MRTIRLTFALLILGVVFAAKGYAANPNCFSGTTNTLKINGIYHTSCFDWVSADGYITGYPSLRNDKGRLQRAIDAAVGKLLFDEADYFIGKVTRGDTGHLNLYPWRIITGTGTADYADPSNPLYPSNPTYLNFAHRTSKIVQMSSGEAIFKIGTNVKDVAIRDLALIGGSGTTGTIGILAEGGTTMGCNPQATPPDYGNCSSFTFQFNFLMFNNLKKGIYVNALNDGQWQFDNVQLNNATFQAVEVGVHINSFNSGWTMKNLEFFLGAGNDITPRSPNTPLSTWLTGKTIGIVLERSTYTSIDSMIANGNEFHSTGALSSALMYIEQHAATVGIRNSTDEGLHKSVYIDGNLSNQVGGANLNFPIELENNTFQAQVFAKDVNLVSIANQYNAPPSAPNFAVASGGSRIYSYADKFCLEDGLNPCPNATFATSGGARIVQSTNHFKSVTDVSSSILLPSITAAQELILRLGLGGGQYYYDITRNQNTGTLDFNGSQGSGVGGGNDLPGYSGYTFNTVGGAGGVNYGATVKINYDGSVTYGSKVFALLDYVRKYDGSGNYLYNHDNGTVVFCSDCQKTTPCGSGGSGALAKRINNSWDCN